MDSVSEQVYFRVDGPGLNRQIRDFVQEGRVSLALRILTDSGVPEEYLKKIVQGKTHIINTKDPRILALIDCPDGVDLTQEILTYSIRHWTKEEFTLAEKAIDLPQFSNEIPLDNYEHCYEKPTSMPWCWITARGKFLPCGTLNHLAEIDKLKARGFLPDNIQECDVEKKWIKVTRSGIYARGNINPRQQIALKLLMSLSKGLFFNEGKCALLVAMNNCHDIYLDSNGNVKLKLGDSNE